MQQMTRHRSMVDGRGLGEPIYGGMGALSSPGLGQTDGVEIPRAIRPGLRQKSALLPWEGV